MITGDHPLTARAIAREIQSSQSGRSQGGAKPAVSGARNIASLDNGYLEGTLQQLEIGLGPLGVEFGRLDLFAFINDVVAQPEAYGLSNVTDPCLTFFVMEDPVCEDPDEYLFWDGIHPTRAAHRQLAKEAVTIVRTGDL